MTAAPALTLIRPLPASAGTRGAPAAPPAARGTVSASPGSGPPSGAAPAADTPQRRPHTLSQEDFALLDQMVPALGTALVEVLVGRRPVHSVERWVTPELCERIRTHAAVRASLSRHTGVRPDTVAAAGGHRLSPVSGTVVEASVVVRTRRRARALAMRFERTRARWRLTEFVSV